MEQKRCYVAWLVMKNDNVVYHSTLFSDAASALEYGQEQVTKDKAKDYGYSMVAAPQDLGIVAFKRLISSP